MPNPIAVAKASGGKFLPSDTSFASSTAEAQFTKGGTLITLALPGSDKLKNKPIKVLTWGRVTGGTTTNFTLNIDYGTSTTIGSNTTIATTGAIACDSASGNFLLELTGVYDSTSDFFQGLMKGHVNGTAVSQAIMSSVARPAVDPSVEGQGFTFTGTFSASHASNVAILDGAEIQLL